MKKIAVTLFLAIAIVMLASSCNREICPAYSQADTENTGRSNG